MATAAGTGAGAGQTTPELIDETTGATSQGYGLTRVYRAGPHTIRVRAVRDSYERQSHLVAEVLSAFLTWTELVTEPAGNWYPRTRTGAAGSADAVFVKTQLGGVADALARRAATVLG